MTGKRKRREIYVEFENQLAQLYNNGKYQGETVGSINSLYKVFPKLKARATVIL